MNGSRTATLSPARPDHQCHVLAAPAPEALVLGQVRVRVDVVVVRARQHLDAVVQDGDEHELAEEEVVEEDDGADPLLDALDGPLHEPDLPAAPLRISLGVEERRLRSLQTARPPRVLPVLLGLERPQARPPGRGAARGRGRPGEAPPQPGPILLRGEAQEHGPEQVHLEQPADRVRVARAEAQVELGQQVGDHDRPAHVREEEEEPELHELHGNGEDEDGPPSQDGDRQQRPLVVKVDLECLHPLVRERFRGVRRDHGELVPLEPGHRRVLEPAGFGGLGLVLEVRRRPHELLVPHVLQELLELVHALQVVLDVVGVKRVERGPEVPLHGELPEEPEGAVQQEGKCDHHRHVPRHRQALLVPLHLHLEWKRPGQAPVRDLQVEVPDPVVSAR